MASFGIPVSVLDLAPIREGEGPREAFQHSLLLAREAEALGYRRYWFAEHHNMASVASSATSVLAGFVAGGTSTIRVGSGGVMLPNHAPLVIAEQFGTLEAMYPGRIDLGLGRAPGTDAVTSYALRRNLQSGPDSFPQDVTELLQYLGPHNPDARVRAVPGEGSGVPVWLLGSSRYSAQLAAHLGLPFAFASHFAPTYLMEALDDYRSRFQPSQYLDTPYAMACVNVIAAPTDGEAEYLATSAWQMALGLIRNRRKPLAPPVASMEGLWSEAEQAAVKGLFHYFFTGSPETVRQGLEGFIRETGVDELMVSGTIWDGEARRRSYGLIAPFFDTAP